jgi:hypothetical protein
VNSCAASTASRARRRRSNWYHLGESQAIRQMLGHRDLPAFVGNINSAPYAPEAA